MDRTSGHPPLSRDIYAFSALFFLIFMGAGAQQAYLVRYLERTMDWSSAACGGVIACVYMSMFFFRVGNLFLFKQWTDRTFTIVGAFSYLVFCLGMASVPMTGSYTFALACAILWGMGAAMMWAGTTMQILRLGDRAGGRHGTGMGILYSSTQAGWLVGAVLLGVVYKSLSVDQLPWLYGLAAAITLAGNLVSFLLPKGERAARDAPSLSSMLAVMARRPAQIASTLQFLSALGYGLILGTFAKYIENAHGAGWVWISISLYPATRMVLSFVGGRMTDRVGYAPVLVSGFLAGSLGLVAAVLWQNPYACVGSTLALALLSSTVPVAAATIVGETAERKRRPLEYGVLFSWRDLGVATAAFGSNVLGKKFPMETVFCVFAALFLGCAILAAVLGRMRHQTS
ncbi:MAG: MFS transporter [Lentisphaeria bacterium]|nr:MFS transporter [Lentisphaeria bacterium]